MDGWHLSNRIYCFILILGDVNSYWAAFNWQKINISLISLTTLLSKNIRFQLFILLDSSHISLNGVILKSKIIFLITFTFLHKQVLLQPLQRYINRGLHSSCLRPIHYLATWMVSSASFLVKYCRFDSLRLTAVGYTS